MHPYLSLSLFKSPSLSGEGIWYQMISCQPYQNSISVPIKKKKKSIIMRYVSKKQLPH